MTVLRSRVVRRVGIGALVGTVFGAAYSVIAGLLYAARGSFGKHADVAIDYPVLVVLYLIGGAVAGAVFGAARRHTRHRLVAFLVGVVATAPLFGTMTLLMVTRVEWWPLGAIVTAVAALVIGGGIGLIVSDAVK